MPAVKPVQLKNLTLPQLEEFALSVGEAKFRARQIFKWIYQKRLASFDGMTNMPKALRAALAERASIDKLTPARVLESSFGDAVKFGFALEETPHVAESVLLLDGARRTACVSSQLGCALGCAFCATAKMGLVRNLTQAEIVGQIVGINDYLAEKGDKPVTNVVFMGMGEALGNFENFRAALGVIMHEDAFNIGARRLTVSTAGVIPYIERLICEDLTIGLAISLNAWNDRQRDALMPINRKYPIARLVEIAKRYHNKTGRRVTFEYVLIAGETDTIEAVEALHRLLGGFPCKINLIPINTVGNTGCGDDGNNTNIMGNTKCGDIGNYTNIIGNGKRGDIGNYTDIMGNTKCGDIGNYTDIIGNGKRGDIGNYTDIIGNGKCGDIGNYTEIIGDTKCGVMGNHTEKIEYRAPSENQIERFADELHKRGLAATIRRSRGQDISGACGQLAGAVCF